MTHRKVIFIIPGFRQRVTNKAYTEISENLKREGYFPILVDIPWKNSTISDNTSYFLEMFKQVNAPKKYILGFSYGAMIAFIAATKVRVSGLMLCSLSPYFCEDLPKKSYKIRSVLMTQRYNDFTKFKCAILARQLKTKNVIMLYGRQEARSLIRRVTNAFDQIDSIKKQLIPISKTEHEIGSRNYLNTIHNAARELL